MFCSSCGKGVQDGANFCANCGSQIGALSQAVIVAIPSDEPSKLKSAFSRVANSVSSMANTVAMEVGDLNGDGKIDAEDFRIAATKAKEIGAATFNEAARVGKEALKSDMAKDAAAGAVVGAAVAIPVPIIGPIAGAAIGAGMGVYKNISKR